MWTLIIRDSDFTSNLFLCSEFPILFDREIIVFSSLSNMWIRERRDMCCGKAVCSSLGRPIRNLNLWSSLCLSTLQRPNQKSHLRHASLWSSRRFIFLDSNFLKYKHSRYVFFTGLWKRYSLIKGFNVFRAGLYYLRIQLIYSEFLSTNHQKSDKNEGIRKGRRWGHVLLWWKQRRIYVGVKYVGVNFE